MEKLSEEIIQHTGKQYEELMGRMKTPSNAGASDHMRESDVIVDFLKNPTDEKMGRIKEEIYFGLSELRTTPEYLNGTLKITEFQESELEKVNSGKSMIRVVNMLHNSTISRQHKNP